MKQLSLFFILLLGLSYSVYSQDTLDKTSQIKSKELLFFSNNACGKCESSQRFFDENKMPYTKFSVKENRPLMYEYIHQKTGGENVRIGYPVVVYGDSIYFSIKNIQTTLEQVKQLMIADGLLEQPDQ